MAFQAPRSCLGAKSPRTTALPDHAGADTHARTILLRGASTGLEYPAAALGDGGYTYRDSVLSVIVANSHTRTALVRLVRLRKVGCRDSGSHTGESLPAHLGDLLIGVVLGPVLGVVDGLIQLPHIRRIRGSRTGLHVLDRRWGTSRIQRY